MSTIGARILAAANIHKSMCQGGIGEGDAWDRLTALARLADAHEALANACAVKHRAAIHGERVTCLWQALMKNWRWMKQSRSSRLSRKMDAARDARYAAEDAERTAYLEWSKSQ